MRAAAASAMAVACGTPMPSTPRVVQAWPGPTPTSTPIAPVRMRCSVVAYEATPPTITGTGQSAMNSLMLSGRHPGRDVLGGDDGALDDEYVEAGFEGHLVVLLDALRRERGGRQDAAVLDLLDAPGDELLFDRLAVDVLHGAGRRVFGQRGDAVELLGGVVVAGLHTLEVEHGKAAELAHGDGEGRVEPPRPWPMRDTAATR